MRLSLRRGAVSAFASLFAPSLLAALTLLLIFASPSPSAAQDVIWIRQFGTTAGDGNNAVAVDGVGNTYVAGETGGTLPGQTSQGAGDAYVRKYNAAGSELWTRQFGTTDFENVYGVAVDAGGNAYVVGYTRGMLPGQTEAGGSDGYVRKYNSSGTELWTRQFGTPVDDTPRGVAVDASGNTYVVGYTFGTLPGQTPAGGLDAWVRKYDSAGSELWTRQFGTPGTEEARGVAVDGTGNAYVAGFTNGTLPGQTLAGGLDAWVRKYDSAGSELWTHQFGTPANDVAIGVAADGGANAYVVGGTDGTLPGETAAGASDAYVRKYDPAGSALWTRQFGTPATEEARGVAVDAGGNAYVAGPVDAALPGQTHVGVTDVFVRKYNPTGSEAWTRQLGSTAIDYVNGVSADGSGAAYVAGYTYGTLPGQTLEGSFDAFVAKICEDPDSDMVCSNVDNCPNAYNPSQDPDACVSPGFDYFETPPGGGLHTTTGDPIPADFFAPGSQPFAGTICLGGEPLNPGATGTADTVIRRLDRLDFPEPPPSMDTVPIEIIQLSLVSCSPITVNPGPTFWDVTVTLSVTPPPPPGQMTVTKQHPNGGVFTSQFNVLPRFTFTEVGNPTNQKVFDFGTEGRPPILLQPSGPTPWVHSCDLVFVVTPNFCPGIDTSSNRILAQYSAPNHQQQWLTACYDPDADGVGSCVDNCPIVANADQLNSDNDPAGDACDPAPSPCPQPWTPDASTGSLWHLDEASGPTAFDSSANGNDGSLVGGVTWATGYFGSALSFDGSSGYVSAADDPTLDVGTGDFTLEACINTTANHAPEAMVIAAKDIPNTGAGYHIALSADNKAECGIRDFNASMTDPDWIENFTGTTNTLNDGNWHHIRCVRAGSLLRLYVDGVLEGQTAIAGTLASLDNSKPFVIGVRVDPPGSVGNPHFFEGLIDEVRLYKAAFVHPCTTLTNYWASPPGDSDCDVFTDTRETFIGTLPFDHCADTPGTDDEPGTDAWPFDFNDDQLADLSDVLKYNTPGVFGSIGPGLPYEARYDLSGDGVIDLSDVLLYNTPGVFGNTCA